MASSSSSASSNTPQAGVARVRLIEQPHTELGVDGVAINVKQQLQVAVFDYASGSGDLRIETERKRKQRRKANGSLRGQQWVRTPHQEGGNNPYDGGNFRGGQQTFDNGDLLPDRLTVFPSTGSFQWIDVPVAQWFKQGKLEVSSGQFDTPVVAGERSTNRYDLPQGPVRWKSIGGPVTLKLRFFSTLPDLLSEYPNDRITGVPSAIVTVTHTRDGAFPRGKPVWPDGLGEAVAENSNSLIMSISHDVV